MRNAEAGITVDGRAFLRECLAFTRELRAEGLTADLAAVLDFLRALGVVEIGERAQVHTAGMALFVRRREDREPYERVFERFWRRTRTDGHRGTVEDRPPEGAPSAERPTADAAAPPVSETRREAAAEVPDGGSEPDPDATLARRTYSAAEVLRHRAFERMTPAELREAERVVARLEPVLDRRRTPRWEIHRRGRLLAPRPMFRHNLGTGGDLVTWLWRRRVHQPRAVVILCDVSGSMERHARLLLRFAQALLRTRARTEAFVFGTRLTRVTRLLRGDDPDRALERVSAAVHDWSGGTRIGESLREFNQRWARRVLPTSGVVIIVSDGWDRGSAEQVATETARLRRNCHRLIWVNPLAGAEGYRPLAAGMAAAYPHLDAFLPASDLHDLEALAQLLATPSRGHDAPSGPRIRAA